MDAVVKKPADLPEAGAPKPVRPTREEAEQAVRTLIAWAGDDPTRDGLRDTPERVAKVFEEFYAGYRESATEVLGRTFEDLGDYDDLVILRDIPFTSHCEHHMVPILGTAHVAYYPGEKVVGLSKLARVIDIYSKRLQTQERLTSQVVTAIDEALKPRGIAILVEAEHLCMTLRGAHKHGASTITTQFTGTFRDDPAEQQRFLTLVGRTR